MVVTYQDQVHMGFHELVEDVLAHGTMPIVAHRDALLVDSRDDPWDARISGAGDRVLDPFRVRRLPTVVVIDTRESGREQDESREGLLPRVVEVVLVAVARSPVARDHRGGERVWTARDVLRHVSVRVAPVVAGDDDDLGQKPFHLRAPPGCVRRVSQISEGEEERHSSRSGTSQEPEGIVIARSPKVSRGGKREVRGGFVLPARLGVIERTLLDRSFLEQDPPGGRSDEDREREDGARSPAEDGGLGPLSWDSSRFLDVAVRDRCLSRNSIRLWAFEGFHPRQRLPK